jgi:hypothetical protein
MVPRLLRLGARCLLASFVGLAFTGDASAADEKQACLTSYEQAQQLRQQGKLKASREQLAVCSREACPKFIRTDCVKWQEEVVASLPTVVVEARDPQGKETILVRVVVDGAVMAERLDGRAFDIDPGPHNVRYEYGDDVIEERVVIREGERNRKLSVSFAKDKEGARPALGATPSGGTSSSGGTPERDQTPTERPVPALTYAFAGLGVVGLGTFAFFALKGKSDEDKLKSDCSPNCAKGDVDDLKTKFLIGDVGLGVGIVSLAVATVVYATRPSRAVTTGSLHLDVTPTHGGGTALVGGSF